MYFPYGDKEINYLKEKDKVLGEAIDKIGFVKREVNTDFFEAMIYLIIGQQISIKGQKTVWNRFVNNYGKVTSQNIVNSNIDELQSLGITFKKAEYILNVAQKIESGQLNPASLRQMDDDEVIKELTALKGIGRWTAEMILQSCFLRPDIISFGDIAILRGMRMLYHHKEIDKKLFNKYQRRYSPYASTASVYLWAIAAGAIPDMKDYRPKTQK